MRVLQLRLLDAGRRLAPPEGRVSREGFLNVIESICPEASANNASRVFVGFDVDREDAIRVRDFIAALRGVRRTTESDRSRMEALFSLYKPPGSARVDEAELSALFSVFTTCDTQAAATRRELRELLASHQHPAQMTWDDFRDLLVRAPAVEQLLLSLIAARVSEIDEAHRRAIERARQRMSDSSL